MISPAGTSENSPAIYCREKVCNCRERFASAVIPAMNCRAIFIPPSGTKKMPECQFLNTFLFSSRSLGMNI